jgi:DnaK suppressor protein
MNKEVIKKKLLAERQRLLNERFELSTTTDDLKDSLDLAKSDSDRSLSAKLKARNIQALVSIEKALSKIDTGSFGECISCEDQISDERLEHNPTSIFCTECQEVAERLKSKFARHKNTGILGE